MLTRIHTHVRCASYTYVIAECESLTVRRSWIWEHVKRRREKGNAKWKSRKARKMQNAGKNSVVYFSSLPLVKARRVQSLKWDFHQCTARSRRVRKEVDIYRELWSATTPRRSRRMRNCDMKKKTHTIVIQASRYAQTTCKKTASFQISDE